MTQKRSPFYEMSDEQKLHFIGGRSAYHQRLRVERDHRRAQLANILHGTDVSQRGWKKAAAIELGVSRWTLRADLIALAAIAADVRRERAQERVDLQDAFQHRLDSCMRGGDRDDI